MKMEWSDWYEQVIYKFHSFFYIVLLVGCMINIANDYYKLE